mmetsp:Transcript_50355/g.51216  ORF Transcript_50355/g.51216 Transcript_50355/m.51216 type:complete len:218 (+) Transcript_50355:196-849(+)
MSLSMSIPTTMEQRQRQERKGKNADDRRSMMVWSDSLRRQSSRHIRVNEDIYHKFLTNSKYEELWKQSGITLNKGESAAAIGMNELRITSELLVIDVQTTTTNETNNEATDDNDDTDDNDETEIDTEIDTKIDTKIDSEIDTEIDTEMKKETEQDRIRRKNHDRVFAYYLQDAHTLSEIRKDLVRTHPINPFIDVMWLWRESSFSGRNSIAIFMSKT